LLYLSTKMQYENACPIDCLTAFACRV
jgi:hypothetical protein